MQSKILTILLLSLLFTGFLKADGFEEALKPLTGQSFKSKQKTIDQLVESYSEHDKLAPLLQRMLAGELYFTKSDKRFVVLTKKEGKLYHTTELLSDKVLEPQNKKMFKKVKTNNKLRSVIKAKLAEIQLFSKKQSIRLASVKNILKNVDQDAQALVQKALKSEQDSEVKEVLTEIDTIIKAKYGSKEEQLQAVKDLGDYLSPQALATLQTIESSAQDERLLGYAKASIKSIENAKSWYAIVEKAFFGLSAGSVLLLAAIGLAITFGVMKVINMAHGEMMMIGAYTTFTLQQMLPNLIEYSIIIAIPLAFLVSAMVGIIIERLVIRHLYGRPLETLLATFGISLILQQLVRSIYSPLNQEVKTPEWMSGALEINSALSLTYNRLYIILFALIVFVAVLLMLKKTSLGLKVRAVTQNREMAQAMGIKTGYIDAITFGIGSGIAGVAGVALSQLTNVGPNLGQAYIVDSFMVVVFGGVGNLWGTLIGAVTLGEINKFIEPVAGAVLAKVIILVFIILFIQKRPRGLFPQKGRDAED
jgi:urea transport system permease protein